ncbi:MAG: sugar ABC transporter substrate-binding protein [Armatimonadota bacterium]|nr:sugar ABC transporter substrate-binding protein [Armatimonadota bacterium]
MEDAAERFRRIAGIVGVILGVVCIIAMGAYLVATANPVKPGQTVIRWVVDPNPIRKEQIKLFESRHKGIKVINDPGAEAQRLLTQLAGDVPPDVMALYDPQTIRLFAKNNVLLDLRPYVKKYNLPIDKLYPQLKPYIYYQGQIVGIPENCGPYVLFYNRKLFREAGIPYPKPGWTWNECLQAAKKLTKYKVIAGRKVPIQKGLYVSNSDWWFFIWMYGGRLFSPDGKRCTMDSEAVKKGIRFWASLRLKHHVMPTSSEAQSMAPTGSWGSEALLFRESKVAMTISGRWLAIQYREQKDLDWDVTSVPHGPNRVTLLASKSYAIPKTCRHKEAAILFIKHLLSLENQLLVANYGDGIPSINTPEIKKAFLWNPEYPNERNNKLHLDEMKYAQVQEYSPYINNVDVVAIMSFELDRMWLGEQTPDEACERIADRINAIIRRNMANPNFLD